MKTSSEIVLQQKAARSSEISVNIYQTTYCYTAVPLYHYTAIPLYHYTAIPLYCCTTILLYRYTAIPLYCYATILLYHYTAILLYHYTAILLYHYTAMPLYRYTAMPHTTALLTLTVVEAYWLNYVLGDHRISAETKCGKVQRRKQEMERTIQQWIDACDWINW